jgi:hypothetical protein
MNIVPRNTSYCTRKLMQYDILLGTILLLFKTTNDTINLRPISERISTFLKMTILSVQIQGYIARLFSIENDRKIFITI